MNNPIEDLDRAVVINPYYVGAYSGGGLARYKLGDYKGAIADYNKAVELNSKLLHSVQ